MKPKYFQNDRNVCSFHEKKPIKEIRNRQQFMMEVTQGKVNDCMKIIKAERGSEKGEYIEIFHFAEGTVVFFCGGRA